MGPLLPGDPERVADYRLLGRLGAGGMGEVFLATSPGGRRVAVKLLRSAMAGDERNRRRFAREVDAARRVGGFHTAQVIDANPDADPPWMVTAYIPGPSLQEAVLLHGALPHYSVRTLAAELVEGLSAIHRCGLVHRDLKPGNVIMADDGARIIDFGVARPTEASSLTSAGAIVGSWAFMSPEQISGGTVTPASDVFSLGCLLAFAAKGEGPFTGEIPPAVIYKIVNGEPDLTGLTEPLRRVISRCLAKDPADRPALLDLLPALAPSGGIGGVSRRAATASAIPRVARPTGGFAGVSVAEPPTGEVPRSSPDVSTEPRSPAGGGIRRRALLVAGLVGVGAAVSAGVVWAESGRTGNHPHRGGQAIRPAATRAPASALWANPARAGELTGHTDAVQAVAFSPDGKALASGGFDDAILVWDVGSRRLIAARNDMADVANLTFSPDGTFLASDGGEVRLWRVGDYAPAGTLNDGTSFTHSVAFDPSGTLLASAGDDNAIRLWDMATRRVKKTLRGTTSVAYHLSWSKDSSLLAASGGDVEIWSVPGGRRQPPIPSQLAVFSPAAELLVLANTSSAGALQLVEEPTGAVKHTLDGHATAVAMAFSPDGTVLAGAGSRSVRLWDTATGRRITDLGGFSGLVNAVAFSPDGTTLAAGGADASVRLWRARTAAG